MKKLFAIFAFALAAAFTASAQGLPKTEFQVLGFGGKSGILYSVDKINAIQQPGEAATALNSYSLDKPMDWPLGYGAGLGFVWNFAPHWGLLTGVEGTIYQGSLEAGNLAFRYATSSVGPAAGVPVWEIDGLHLTAFKETQKIMTVQIPLMLQFNVALNQQQSIHWYLAAGAKLALNLKGEYSSKFNVEHYQAYARYTYNQNQEQVVEYYNMYQYGQPFEYKKEKLDVNKFNALASLETGFRFKLGESAGLYLGVYADYGLMRAVKLGKGKVVAQNTDNLNRQDNYTPGRQDIVIADGAVQSILRAHGTDYVDPTTPVLPGAVMPDIQYHQNSDPLAKGVNLASAGVKLRLSFGPRSAPKVVPVSEEPQIIYVPQKKDTVTVEKVVVEKDTVTVTNTVTVKDTVTVEKVVRDTVIIIKEVPVEIQKVMKDLSNTLFKFNKFNLGETEKGYLDQVADWIKSEPEINVE
ncbi:MAG: outer membrane beta-barrel protein, partial [Bacteroidales bacterium]|nr:outer membrane beta-barrel protein [Bacteroidales bacterium]